MSEIYKFNPDIIVEVTSVCDRACIGCYAPNIVSSKSPEVIMSENPSLFLKADILRSALLQISDSQAARKLKISVRGGEPTRHPLLGELLAIAAKHASCVYLETHGRWILDSNEFTKSAMEAIRNSATVVKLSFDRMHRTKPETLVQMIERLEESNINYLIAITEKDSTTLAESRALIRMVPAEKIIFQPLASSAAGLVRPNLCVINVSGRMDNTLTTHLPAAFAESQVWA